MDETEEIAVEIKEAIKKIIEANFEYLEENAKKEGE